MLWKMLCKCPYCEQEIVGLSAVTFENELSVQTMTQNCTNSEKPNQTKALVFELIMVLG